MRFVLAALLFSTTGLAQSTPSDSLDLSSLKVEKVVTLTSTPEKAEVYSLAPNGQKTLLCKATPCKRNLEVKDHSLVFVHEGFEAERRTLRLAKNTQLHAVFESPYAQIRFSVTPKNSQISINGGQAQSSDRPFPLTAGSYNVQIKDACAESPIIGFNVKKGESKLVNVSGTPTFAGLQISAIDSQGDAIEAELFIDGVLIGAVPGVYKVPACAKTLAVRKQNVVLNKGEADESHGHQLMHEECLCLNPNKTYQRVARLKDFKTLGISNDYYPSNLMTECSKFECNSSRETQNGINEIKIQRGAGGLGSRGSGMGGGNFGPKSAGGFGRFGGNPIIMGALDKSLIDRVIKQHMNQIKHCYQRELNANPTLGGLVTVKFVITGDGTVSSAKTIKSTLSGKGASSVNSCINSRFLAFQFPKPKGGGMVIVQYPFIFQPK